MYYKIYFCIFFFVLIGCNQQKEEKLYYEQENIKYEQPEQKDDLKNLLQAFDRCHPERFCKARYRFHHYLRQNTRAQNYKLFKNLLKSGTTIQKSWALLNLFAYKTQSELVPLLIDVFEKTEDIGIVKLCTILLLLSENSQGQSFVIKHWQKFPSSIRVELIWALRQIKHILKPEFIMELSRDNLPALRAFAIEIKTERENQLEPLISCIRKNNSESAHCASNLVKTNKSGKTKALIAIIKYFSAEATQSKYRLNVPITLLDSLEILQKQNLLSRTQAVNIGMQVLSNRHFSDKFRGFAARLLGRLGTKKSRIFLDKYRHDRRRRVGYQVRRAIYLMEKNNP